MNSPYRSAALAPRPRSLEYTRMGKTLLQQAIVQRRLCVVWIAIAALRVAIFCSMGGALNFITAAIHLGVAITFGFMSSLQRREADKNRVEVVE